MPGVYRFGINKLEAHLTPSIKAGLSSVLLFGVPSKIPKDHRGSGADSPQTPVILAVRKLRDLFPELVIACDVSTLPNRYRKFSYLSLYYYITL